MLIGVGLGFASIHAHTSLILPSIFALKPLRAVTLCFRLKETHALGLFSYSHHFVAPK
jgi:hypothetical protein